MLLIKHIAIIRLNLTIEIRNVALIYNVQVLPFVTALKNKGSITIKS